MTPRSAFAKAARGLTLVETVISIALVGSLVIVFGISLIAATYARRVQWRNMATALADMQLAVLQTYASGSIPAQTDGPLIGVLFPQGDWGVAAGVGAPSTPNVLALAATGSATGVTAVQPFPNNAYADSTATVSFKVMSSSPASWQAGLLIRAVDLRNHYQASLTSNALVLKKMVDGAETTLYSDVRSVATDTWQTLSVTATGSSISVSLNGNPVTTVNDTAFSAGKTALAVWNAASVDFDDASIDASAWNFDATAVGEIPDDWLRFGLSDLPDGAGSLTVTELYGNENVKKYDTVISWQVRGETHSTTATAITTN